MSVTVAQLEVLTHQDDQTLAEWYCILNSWKWPEGLPDPERPDHFNNGPKIRSAVMDYITARVGKRLISRTHNRDMPDDVFESFWRDERGPETPYGRWSEQKVASQMAVRQAKADRVIASEIVLEDILDAEFIDG